jgi:predicted O-methyltransferase YrrM
MNNINFEYFGLKSPYKRFDKKLIDKNCDIKNWQYPDSIPMFEQFITELKPEVIIEVGTFLGWSSITMGSICRKNGLNTKILCIDTWLGSIEHWRVDKCNSLIDYDFFQNGTSVMFDNFCKNVISHELEDYIIPIPNSSTTAYSFLKHKNIKSDLIYIDADHSYHGVLSDLNLYYTLLNSNGIIFGDDAIWEDIERAVFNFSSQINRKVLYSPNKSLYYVKK